LNVNLTFAGQLYNKEKGQRSNRLPTKSDLRIKQDTPPIPRSLGRKPSLRHVDFILEDEEEVGLTNASTSKNLQGTLASSTGKTSPPTGTRNRSFSASQPPSASRIISKKSSYTDVEPSTPPTTNRERRVSQTLPVRTRTVDLNNVTKHFDDEVQAEDTPLKRRTPLAVSAKTRDLIDFLSEGPPDSVTPDAKAGFFTLFFLLVTLIHVSQVNASAVSLESGRSKGSGRLQRMISKFSMGNSNETRVSNGDFSRKSSRTTSSSTPPPSIQSRAIAHNVILAPRPVPPRPPPIYPPSSSSQDSLVERSPLHLHSRNGSVARRDSPLSQAKPIVPEPLATSSPRAKEGKENGTISPQESSPSTGQFKYGPKEHTNIVNSKPIPPPATATVPLSPEKENTNPIVEHRPPKRPVVQPTLEAPEKQNLSQLAVQRAREVQQQMLMATSAEECRLLFDMFIAKSGVPVVPAIDELPYPSPALSVPPPQTAVTDADLEHSLVELLLGGDNAGVFPLESDTRKTGLPVEVPSPDFSKPDADTPSQIENDTPLSASSKS